MVNGKLRMNVWGGIFFILFLLTAFLPGSAESVRVILEETFENAPGAKLPVMESLVNLLPPAGLTRVDGAADITMKIILKGRALSGYYSEIGSPGYTAYSGAHISGEVSLLEGEKVLIKKTFSEKVEPPKAVIKGAFKEASQAPFHRVYHVFVRTALETLVEFKGKNLLVSYMKSADRLIRKEAAYLIGELNMASAVEQLKTALKDKDLDVIVEALKSMAKLKVPGSIESLLVPELLLSPYTYVRETVLIALDEMDPAWRDGKLIKSLFPSILSALKHSDVNRREAAVRVLVEIYDPQVLKPLIMALADGHVIRIHALKVLDKNEPDWRKGEVAQQLVPYFLKFLKDPDSREKDGAVAALKEIASPQAEVPLIQSLTIQTINVSAVLDVLNDIYPNWADRPEAGSVIPYFLGKLKSSNWRIRYNAMSILAAIKDARVVPPLLKALNDKTEKIKIKAIEGLALSHEPTAVKAVQEMVYGNDFVKKAYAVSFLGKSTAPGSLDLLIAALKDDHKRIRYLAVKAMGEKKDQRVVEHLRKALEDPEEEVRKEAAKILNGWKNGNERIDGTR
jgi:HEAT repeat protein